MKRKMIVSQMKWILQKKESLISVGIITFLCLINFIRNVVAFRGEDVVHMFQPMKLMLLSYNRTYYQADMTMLFMLIYPILVTLPAGFRLYEDMQQGKYVYLISRIGKKTYYSIKLIAIFGTTFIQFTIPYILELILYCVSFPMEATGDLSRVGYLSMEYAEMVQRYGFARFYIYHPVLYTLFGIIGVGMLSGLLAVFSVIIAELFRIRYGVLIFMPVFLLIYMLKFLDKLVASSAVNLYRYLFLFCDEQKNYLSFGVIIGSIVLFEVIGFWCCVRRECL